jgi:hypothetical protein
MEGRGPTAAEGLVKTSLPYGNLDVFPRGGHIHRVRADNLAIGDLHDLHFGVGLQQSSHHAAAMRVQVLDNDIGHGAVNWQIGKHQFQGFQTAGRGADAYHKESIGLLAPLASLGFPLGGARSHVSIP